MRKIQLSKPNTCPLSSRPAAKTTRARERSVKTAFMMEDAGSLLGLGAEWSTAHWAADGLAAPSIWNPHLFTSVAVLDAVVSMSAPTSDVSDVNVCKDCMYSSHHEKLLSTNNKFACDWQYICQWLTEQYLFLVSCLLRNLHWHWQCKWVASSSANARNSQVQ